MRSSASTTQACFVLRFPISRWGFLTVFYRYFARHCCWHRNFHLSSSGFHCELEFFVVWFNEEYSSQLSGTVELWFLESPSLFCFFFAAPDICVHRSGHTLSGLEVVCFLVSLLPDHVYPSGGLSVNKVNIVKPVHAHLKLCRYFW